MSLETLKDLYRNLNADEQIEALKFVYNHRPHPARKFSELLDRKAEKTFDEDLANGLAGEFAFLGIASTGKYEVKRDFRVSDTGNVAIEIECRKKPSGISITKAKYWVLWLSGEEYQDEVAILIATHRLREIAETCRLKYVGDTNGGNRGVALAHLVPLKKLFAKRSQIEKCAKLPQLSLFETT